MEIQPRLLNIEQTAKYIGLAPKTIRNRLGPKAPDPFPIHPVPKRLGKKVLFDIRDLDKFIDSLSN